MTMKTYSLSIAWNWEFDEDFIAEVVIIRLSELIPSFPFSKT